MAFETVFKGAHVCLVDKDTGVPYNAGSPAAGATSIAKEEDAAHASSDVGIMTLAVRKDTAVATAADGDYVPLIVDSTGRLWVHSSDPPSVGYKATASFTPAAAAYLANDVMSVAQQFTAMGPAAGGEVMITSVELQVAHTAIISGETSYRLYLYNVTPPSAHADNDAWDLPSGDRTAFLGYVDLGTPVDLGSTLYVQTDGINKQITVPSGAVLFGELVTVGAFTATAVARKVVLHAVGL